MQKKITVFDVAKAAGVSKGTVDRVLHNRGEVSKQSEEKVRKAIEELGYERNVYASLLASRSQISIAFLLPHSSCGEYWKLLEEGILSGKKYAENFNVNVECFYYDQYDPASFCESCKRLLESNPSGVILPPLFKKDTAEFAQTLKNKNIPFIYIDTKIEDTSYLAYYGMPMFDSGRLCAFLLTERCQKKDVDKVLMIRILRDKESRADPTSDRREGFKSYMAENFPDCEIESVFVNPKESEQTNLILSKYLHENPELKYVVMFNSRIHLVASILENHPCEGRRVVGFDTLKDNIAALKGGAVDILISQHAHKQSEYAITSLVDYVVLNREPENRNNYMHMDIITKYNVENYD